MVVSCVKAVVNLCLFVVIAKTDSEDKLKALLHACIESNIRIVRHAVEEVDNPALSGLICSPDYLNSLSTSCEEALSSAISSETVGIADICDIVTRIAHTHSNYIIQGRATSNTCPDISFGESKLQIFTLSII